MPLSMKQVLEAARRDDNEGFCLACGSEVYGVEPDAEDGPCGNCGANKVYGAEQILICGLAA